MNVDIEAIRSQVPSLVTPVVFTNSQGKEVTLKKSGYQEAGTASIIDVK